MPLAPNINTPIAPHVDIDVDISLLEHELARFAEATDRDLAAVLRQQAGLLGEDMMRATPPVGKFTGAKESWSAQRKIGRAAVGRDIDRMAGSFNELEMMSGTGRLATRMRKLDTDFYIAWCKPSCSGQGVTQGLFCLVVPQA